MRRSVSPRVDGSEFSPFALPSSQHRRAQPFARDEQWPESNGKESARHHRRGGFLVWNPEKIVLVALFLGALMVGYFASTWLWRIELAEPLAGLLPGAMPNTTQDAQTAALDSMDARTASVFPRRRFQPPYTREKVLQYFRPLHYGEASLERHGGNRHVEIEMAQELLQVYKKQRPGHSVALGGNALLGEADLWEERVYRGEVTGNSEDAHVEKQLSQELAVLAAEEQQYDVLAPSLDASHPARYGFRAEEEASLGLHSRGRVCGALETSLGQPMDERRNVLFIIGTQKGGTTFLFNALKKHAAFVGADHAYGQGRGPWAKEVHFFNRWPLPSPPKREFLRCFPSATWNIAKLPDPNNFTLVDATPDYMFNAMAPPRIKAIFPNAKFLVLLRDPIARAYSAWAMSKRMACRQQAKANPFASCEFPSFAQMVVDEVRLLKRQGCTFSRAGTLRPKSWSDCYGCRASFADAATCAKDWKPRSGPCAAPPFLTLSVSTYAAQLAWWFAYFPRARFKFVTSADMHTRDPTPILNDIIDFTGVRAAPFNPAMMRDVWGYNGGYNITDLSHLDLKTVSFLQLYYRQANADLQALLAPLNFTGVPYEIPVQ